VPRKGVVLVVLVAATLALAGCGGDSTSPSSQSRHFEQHGFEITFHYPAELEEADDLILGTTAGAADSARAGVGIDKDNVILVSRYELRRAVTAAGLAGVKPEVDGVIENLAGRKVSARRVSYGDLPGYAYRVPLGSPQGGVSRLFVLFDRAVEYFFNCQSTPESRVQIDSACDEALNTLEKL
jgi:hypothetical protein